MDRQAVNRICGIVPVIMSATAFLMALLAGLAGVDRGATDEGTLAHIFQLLIVAQAPLLLAFVATADWGRLARVARPLALQAIAAVLALAPVFYFKL